MNGTNDVLLVQGGADDLTDDALRQVLARAPDRGALPDWQLRQTILQHAHDAVADQEALLHALREPTPWWRLDSWWKKGERRALTPWSAAVAVVLVAGGVAAALWPREPAPAGASAGPGEARVRATVIAGKASGPPTSAAPSAVPAAPPLAPNSAPGAPTALVEPTRPGPLTEAAAVPAPLGTHMAEVAPRSAVSLKSSSESVPEATAEFVPTAAAASASATAHEANVNAPADAKRSPAPERPSPPAGQRASTAAADSAAAQDPGNAAGAGKPALRALTPVTPSAPAAVAAAKPTLPADAAAKPASVSLAPAPAPAARTDERTDETPPPSFAALSQWTDMRIAYEGQSRTVSRAKAGELALLVGSAAIVADGPQRLRSRTPWRVTLLRGGKPLAVLAIAQGQVQWTEGKSPPASGTPPPGSLDALRGALNMALEAPPDQPANLSLADRLERELAQSPRGDAGQGAPATSGPVTPR